MFNRKEWRKEYNKTHKEPPEKWRTRVARYRLKHPERIKATNSRYVKENPWVKTMSHIRARVGKISGYENIKNMITVKELKTIWLRDKAYLMEKPSIDRINSKGDYTFTNCQYIELSENCRKGAIERWSKFTEKKEEVLA